MFRLLVVVASLACVVLATPPKETRYHISIIFDKIRELQDLIDKFWHSGLKSSTNDRGFGFMEINFDIGKDSGRAVLWIQEFFLRTISSYFDEKNIKFEVEEMQSQEDQLQMIRNKRSKDIINEAVQTSNGKYINLVAETNDFYKFQDLLQKYNGDFEVTVGKITTGNIYSVYIQVQDNRLDSAMEYLSVNGYTVINGIYESH